MVGNKKGRGHSNNGNKMHPFSSFMIDEKLTSCYIWTHFMKTFLFLNGMFIRQANLRETINALTNALIRQAL